MPSYYGKYKKFSKPLDRARMLELLEMNEDEVLVNLNAVRNGLRALLEARSHVQEDIAVLINLIAKACHAKNQKGITKLFRTIFWYNEKFLKRVPAVIHDALNKKRFEINLSHLVQDFILILRHVLRKKLESFLLVRDIYHQLQNYLNRMKLMKIKHINEIWSEFQELERDLEKQEELYRMECAVNEEPPDDFRELPVMPRSNDVINCPVPFLRPNIIDASYSTVDHYLDIHFRLMREDMLRSFRKSVAMFRQKISTKKLELDGASIFEKVRVHHPCEYTTQGIFYRISFKTPKAVNWKLTKSLIQGSLVCLTCDKFKTVIFAVVKDRQPQTGSDRNCQIKVTLEHPEDELPECSDFIMIETTAYFEPYKHVLSNMQSFKEANFPLSDSIVYLDFEDTDADYLDSVPFCLHEQCPPDPSPDAEHPCKIFDVLDLSQWPSAAELKLDEYQHRAFQTALSKNLSLIQGPPGTGKTFLGVKIVKALLDNSSQDRPIIVSCYTNHALDQFLERIHVHTNKIVRIGNQGKSEMLKPHVLSSLISTVRQCRFETDHSSLRSNPLFDKSYRIIKSLVPDMLELGNAPRPCDDKEVIIALRKACDEIKGLHSLLYMAEKEYFDDDILNAMIDSNFKEQFRKGEGSNMKVLSRTVKQWLALRDSKALYQKCNSFLVKNEANIESLEEECENHIKLWEVPLQQRFNLFFYWRQKCINILKQKLTDEISSYKEYLRKLDKSLDPDIYALIKNAKIVGMTTTGAAMYSNYMRAVQPHVIIIEEAAEVLESHIIATLVPSIQHVILIGDHEQLRPLPADHDLAVNFNLNISLFERLIKNGAPSATLCSQHRMRPCIAELLVPNIYETLLSHESVSSYENVKGISHNMFFVQHSEVEDVTSFGKSFSNEHEAKYIVELCKYFLHQGYDGSQITILTTYGGQQSQIIKFANETLMGVHITTVDNFQGEENDIILISFVRSNPSGAIGFLKESNRVCVALSRARKGLYCIGNFEQYARKSELWSSIVHKLKERGVFGKDLPLQCQNHKVKTMHVSEPVGFQNWLSSGCGLPCGYMLPCGHECAQSCHLDDPDHTSYRCQETCERIVNVDGMLTTCRKRCCEPCETKRRRFVNLPCGHKAAAQVSDCLDVILNRYNCTAKVKKRLPCGHLDSVPCHISSDKHKCCASVRVILNCGHEKFVPCHKQSSPGAVVCQELKNFNAPCGHIVDVPCFVSPDDDNLLSYCTKSCQILLKCGHPCTGYCRWCFDTNIHTMCIAPCDKRLPCGHQCEGTCDAPCPPCKKMCQLKCPHSNCVNPCERLCVKCKKPCSWQCDHFKCKAACWENCSGRPCSEPCPEILGCGHPCIGFCGEPCPYLCRMCNRDMLDCEDPETDRFVLLENCDHIVEVKKLTSHINNKREVFEWPDCPVCFKIITHSTRFYKELKDAKAVALKNASVDDKTGHLFFLLHTMFGETYSIGWRFQDVHRKIEAILMHQKPSAAALSVLENCLLFLKDLVHIDGRLKEVDDPLDLGSMLETLILWICNHLTCASYQQISEVEDAVQNLKDRVKALFDE